MHFVAVAQKTWAILSQRITNEYKNEHNYAGNT